MTIILAADTSTTINTVALCRSAASPAVAEGAGAPSRVPANIELCVLAETVVECGRLHSERLLGTVDWVLAEAGLGLEAVDVLAVSIGPGSFTGLRIGAATWKGLAFARGLPLVAVPTLDALTRTVSEGFDGGVLCAVLDARMREVFGAVYRFSGGFREKCVPERVGPVEALLVNLAGRVLFVGDGAELYRERIRARVPEAVFASGVCAGPRASAVAAEALVLVAAGAPTDAAVAEPIYLRQSQAEVNRARRLAGEEMSRE